MQNEKVQWELKRRFAAPLPEFYRRRIIFWKDEDREFEKDVDALNLEGVKIVKLTGTNNFAVKKLLLHDDLESNYLIYCPITYTGDEDNWLQDIEYYSETFRADFISMQMDELNIAPSAAMRKTVKLYARFFDSKERIQMLRVQSEETMRIYKKRLAQAEKRIGELDRLFIRIYEDNVAGRLDDEHFAMMSKNYTEEQKGLKAEVKSLQQEIEEQERQAENLEQFIQRVHRNSNLTELTPYALRELVKAVYVEAPDKSSGKRKQKIHICYDLIGFIPVDVLLKAEQA